MKSFKKLQNLVKKKNDVEIEYEYEYETDSEDETSVMKPLSNPKLLSMINTLSAINLQTIKPPKMVVIGTQSSGKSSLLNGIIGMTILPTGKDMVTRTPLILELDTQLSPPYAFFGKYTERGEWVTSKTISLSDKNYETQISNEIQKQTRTIAGVNMNVNPQPIYLRVLGPDVPSMTLVDLPGLTMVARQDQGQPADIKDQIRNMAKQIIVTEQTIIMCVMAARSDLETDMALDLAKEVDPDGRRTIGILTKVDLMNKDSHIGDYLKGTCSSDLWFRYGYYAVRNKTSEDNDLETALNEERVFFNSHPIYSEFPEKTGIKTVAKQLSTILMAKIQEELPHIKSKIETETVEIKSVLESLGLFIPTTDINETLNILDTILTKISTKFNNDINSQGINSKYGSDLRKIFSNYRSKIKTIRPIPSTEKLTELIHDSQGNHMDFSVSPISIVEQYILCTDILNDFLEPSYDIIKQTIVILEKLALEILEKQHITQRFPNLSKEIINILQENIWNEEYIKEKILEIIEYEQSYLWTENKLFRDTLSKKTENDDIENFIQKLCSQYLDTVDDTLSNIIPKICMKHLITKSRNLNILIKTKLQTFSLDRLQYLLMEDNSVNQQRSELNLRYEKLQSAKKLLSGYW